MGKYSPFNLQNIAKRREEKEFRKKYGRAPVKAKPTPLTGMTNINQSRQWAEAQNHKIKTETKSAKRGTAQWGKPAAHFELRATFFENGSMGSLYKAPASFGPISNWEFPYGSDGLACMACSAQTLILATSPRALTNYLEEYRHTLGVCARSTEEDGSGIPIRVAAGTFRATSNHLKAGAHISWVADAAKALAANSMALGAPTNLGQDVTAVVRTAMTLDMGKKDSGKPSKEAQREQLLQGLRNNQPGLHSLGGCAIVMGIIFSHFMGESLGNQRYYSFDELLDIDAVNTAITLAHERLKQEQSQL